MCPGVAQSPSNNKKKKCSGTTGEYHVLTWIFQCMSAMKLLKKKKLLQPVIELRFTRLCLESTQPHLFVLDLIKGLAIHSLGCW